MGPALGSASALDAMVSEGEKRVKSQGDVAVNHIYEEIKRGLDHFQERAILHDENFLKRAEAEHVKKAPFWTFGCKGPWKIRAWRA